MAALAGLYGKLPDDQAAEIERECAAVPYRGDRQRDLALHLPEKPDA